MAEISKSVRARLAAQQSSGVTEHPDADLLSAFAEHALSGGERERVAGHLSQCGVCREVVSTALPEVAAVEVSTAPAQPSHWLRTPVLRWVAVGAAVVVVGAAVVLHKPEQPQWTPAADREKKVEVAPGEARQVAEPPANTPAKAPAADAPGAGKHDESAKAVPSPAELQRKYKQVAPASSSSASLDDKAQALHSETKELAAKRRDMDQLTAEKDKLAKSSKEAGARQQAPGGQNARMNALPPPQPIPAAPPTPLYADQRVTTQRRSVDKNGAVKAAPATRNEIGAGMAGATPDQAQRKAALARATPPPAPSATAPASSAAAEAQAGDTSASGAALGGIAQVRPQPAAAERTRWTITPDGKLQRSVNGGASWELVVVNDNVEFHAVASIGADVWAGGSGGALYHSTDSGEHWTRVSFATPSSVVRIKFTDSANGEVKTSSGETWATQDSGVTWKRR